MSNKGLIRRVLPFLATFAVGIFITSFFVSITGPSFKSRGFGKRHQEIKRLKIENEELRIENLNLRNGNESRHRAPGKMCNIDHFEKMNLGPEFPVDIQPPPMPVVRRSHR